MNIPAFDLNRQTALLKNEFTHAVESVVNSGAFILGKEVQCFEEEAASFLGAKHGIGCASGTDALQLVLMASEFSGGDEVITTPFTFVATADVVSLLGLKPVFVDIDPDTHNISVDSVQKALTGRTRAVLPVHLFGRMLNVDELNGLCSKHGIMIFEDCAQSFGAELNGKKAGTVGDAGCFSFYPTKNLGAFGDGGLIVTNNDDFAGKLRAFRAHGQVKRYVSDYIGINSRLDSMQAAILRVKLPYVRQWNERRRSIAVRYNTGLKNLPVKVPAFDPSQLSHVFHQYSIEASHRDDLRAFLAGRGISTVTYYPVPLHLQPAFSYLGYKKGDLPVVERVCDSIISLPMFPELADDEADGVVNTIREFYTSRG